MAFGAADAYSAAMNRARSVQSPLVVGRDHVLSLIADAVVEAGAGRGRLVLLAGEAGIGKTRLIGAAMRQAAGAGFRVAKGDLSPNDQLVSLASIGDLARSMRRDAFGALGPEILAIQGGKDGDSLARRRILVHEISDRVVAGIDRPTALAFEDLQWADELSLEVIGELARAASQLPLLLLGSYRLDELPTGSIHREWRSRLLTQRFAEELRLDRLSHDETALVTTLILDTGLPAPREVVDAVHERTNGIPLHVEELLAALRVRGDVDGRTIRDAAVPDTIEDAVLARAARLSPEARAVAQAGAVLGRSFVPEVVAGIMDRPREELDAPLDELVVAGVLNPFDHLGRGFFDFRHQLLRDAIYGSVPALQRRRWHARAAEFGQQIAGASEVHASVHFERAGQKAEAFRAALAGAEKAASMTSRFEAFELYRRAIDNIPDGLTAVELGDLYSAYENAAMAVDDIVAAEHGLELSRRWYLEAGRPIDAATTLIGLWVVARRDVRPRSERVALAAQAERELLALPESPERSTALSDVRWMQAVTALDGVELDRARSLLDEHEALAREGGASETSLAVNRLDTNHMRAWADALGGDVEGGLSRMLALSREARDANMESTGVTNYRIAADVAIRLMDYPIATVGATEGLRYADEVEQSYCRHVMAAATAQIAWAEGRWNEAIATAEIELVERGSRRGTLGSRVALAFVALGRGDVDGARELLDAALAVSRPSGEVDLVLPALWGKAEAALIGGDPARAFDHCREAAELAAPTGERALLVPFVVTGVRAALADKRPEAAARWLDRTRELLRDWAGTARPAFEHADGLVKLAAGSTVAARSALEAAVADWDARGRIWEATWARLDLATCHVRSNRYAEAIRLLDEITAIAGRLASDPVRIRAEELGRLARSRGGEVEAWYPLSSREFEVAQKIAEGLTNAGIGEELFVSPKTVGAHVEHILAKLGVSRRAEIAAWVSTVRAPATNGHEVVAPAEVARARG